jgi:ESCRT-I complex subunit VPS28
VSESSPESHHCQKGFSSMKAYSNPHEREVVETMADIYSIFIAVENLEKAYIRDSVSHEE